MRIALAQIQPERGDVDSNLINHQHFITRAVEHHVDMIIFPELSLTGYEPCLAKDLATDLENVHFKQLQTISDVDNIVIGVGMPIRKPEGVQIGMVLFRPGQPAQVNGKKYLHADEEPFFIPGENITGLQINGEPVALAICYEISIPQHAADAHAGGAAFYIASVAKTANGVAKSHIQLAETAQKYSMTVLMCNAIGMSEDGLCTGGSAVWNNQGELLAKLDDNTEDLLIYDSYTQEVVEKGEKK
jgi:predicted amidohydrolase